MSACVFCAVYEGSARPSLRCPASLKPFATFSLLHKLLLLLPSVDTHPPRLNTKEIEGLRKQFIAVDTDNSGIVSLEEFTRAMNSTIHESKEIQTLFRKMDMDNTGTISYVHYSRPCWCWDARARFLSPSMHVHWLLSKTTTR
jgi:hypothetical protein